MGTPAGDALHFCCTLAAIPKKCTSAVWGLRTAAAVRLNKNTHIGRWDESVGCRKREGGMKGWKKRLGLDKEKMKWKGRGVRGRGTSGWLIQQTEGKEGWIFLFQFFHSGRNKGSKEKPKERRINLTYKRGKNAKAIPIPSPPSPLPSLSQFAAVRSWTTSQPWCS